MTLWSHERWGYLSGWEFCLSFFVYSLGRLKYIHIFFLEYYESVLRLEKASGGRGVFDEREEIRRISHKYTSISSMAFDCLKFARLNSILLISSRHVFEWRGENFDDAFKHNFTFQAREESIVSVSFWARKLLMGGGGTSRKIGRIWYIL